MRSGWCCRRRPGPTRARRHRWSPGRCCPRAPRIRPGPGRWMCWSGRAMRMRWRWPPRRAGRPSSWCRGVDGVMLIATVSAKGAPGVSVASLAWTLQWPRPVLLAECEPRGSDFQVGYAHDRAGGGRDLLAVHMNSQRGAAMDAAVREQVLRLGVEESRWLLLGVPEPQQAAAVDWPRLARTLATWDGVDVIADCGVIGPGRPYSLAEVKTALRPASVVGGPEVPVVPVIETLPWDENAAEFLSTGVPRRRGFAGSKLAAQAVKSASALIDEAERLKTAATAARSAAPSPAFAGVHDL